HTWSLFHSQGGDDSWGNMAPALDYARSPHTTPLYGEIFFNRHIKFQYPPSALLALAGMRLLDPARIHESDFYRGPLPTIDQMISFAFIALMAVACAALLEVRLRQTPGFDDRPGLAAVRAALVVAFTLTFYPVVKAFTLGQIQVWINSLFALSLLCWVLGRKASSGVLIGLICLIKPHYGLFLLWAAVRRERRFALACAVTGCIGLAASVAVFGAADHIDYLRTLSFMSQHGETYYPNQSVNGLLNRLTSLGGWQAALNLEFFGDQFPPFNPLVYGGTLATSAVILLAAIVHRRGEAERALDFATMAVSATVASPIAWEHHYGVLLPVFVLLLASATASGIASGIWRRGWLAWFVLSYVLASNFIPVTHLLASSALNVGQSYLFAGALILLVLLHLDGARSPLARASPPSAKRP
ncbi:MAG: alpha,2-mannosyltransferase, partial [Alphaproteobacteria bacterium]|nr:alpha,2-mannosyltransferase [Alphaproteobacteria bacterium]